jgi:hypothetical protein
MDPVIVNALIGGQDERAALTSRYLHLIDDEGLGVDSVCLYDSHVVTVY